MYSGELFWHKFKPVIVWIFYSLLPNAVIIFCSCADLIVIDSHSEHRHHPGIIIVNYDNFNNNSRDFMND